MRCPIALSQGFESEAEPQANAVDVSQPPEGMDCTRYAFEEQEGPGVYATLRLLIRRTMGPPWPSP